MSRAVRVLCIVAIYGLLLAPTYAKPKKKMANIDLDALEKEWEKGDDKELLVSDSELERQRVEAERAEQPPFDPSNPQAFLNAKTPGPVMMFADVVGVHSKKDLDNLCSRWSEMLKLGGIQAQVYNIEDSKVLLNVQRGQQAEEVKTFCLDQPEVSQVTLNNERFYKSDKQMGDGDILGSGRKATAASASIEL